MILKKKISTWLDKFKPGVKFYFDCYGLFTITFKSKYKFEYNKDSGSYINVTNVKSSDHTTFGYITIYVYKYPERINKFKFIK